jgi:hypothetical protein
MSAAALVLVSAQAKPARETGNSAVPNPGVRSAGPLLVPMGTVPGRRAESPERISQNNLQNQPLSVETVLAVAVVAGAITGYLAMILEICHLLLH